MNYFAKQNKLREMLLTVLTSSNIRKTFNIKETDPDTLASKVIDRNEDGYINSKFLNVYKNVKGKGSRYTIHEDGFTIIIEDRCKSANGKNPYRHLNFYSKLVNTWETWTLSNLFDSETFALSDDN
jgi:hypothetical protein